MRVRCRRPSISVGQWVSRRPAGPPAHDPAALPPGRRTGPACLVQTAREARWPLPSAQGPPVSWPVCRAQVGGFLPVGVAGITSSFQDTQGDGGPGRTQGLWQLLWCGDRASGGKEDVGAFGRPCRPGTQKPPPWARLHMDHGRERPGLPVLEEGRGQGRPRNRETEPQSSDWLGLWSLLGLQPAPPCGGPDAGQGPPDRSLRPTPGSG